MSTSWEVVIGLEIHVQLATKSKIFSGSSTAYGAEPNTQANLVDLGYPGVLPVLNEEVIRMATLFGLSVNANISPRSVFARKNYFYPDLPKGYQISQLELPIIENGELHITCEDGSEKCIGITRAHLEEDAGKSIHDNFESFSGIDLNRAGTPLLEIVSEPDLRSAKEAVTYMRKIHSIVNYLEISDGNLQEGSFRCDANVSVRPKGQKELGTRTELKNLNSFRFIERAINVEIERQIDLIEDDNKVIQETRLYDSDRDETRSMRSKEEANDYRYFPDPDLLPVDISAEYIELVQKTMPELPDEKMHRFINDYELKSDDVSILITSRPFADYYERVVKLSKANAKIVANWVIGDLSAALNRDNLDIKDSKISSDQLAGLLDRISDSTISQKIGKQVFESMWKGEGSADVIIASKGLKQITDSNEIESIILKIIDEYPNQVAEYKSGKEKLLGFFVGKVMQETKGQANPGQVNKILKDNLN
ncbi:MAG: Asp-tRNA(Asn)/Glu-tRNA(Gln) amidotransferase GatCAB subunit B [Woeseia sp.]|nr:Asp-tRNA(Asn)/Glu-tRNA(Gln) amidotransferase GatCAB subunit B [Woeseia sp.]|tara:strand:+ start:9053 stop:10492 length:1440 start_codon:yes stop_codon:yes gene_type:complete